MVKNAYIGIPKTLNFYLDKFNFPKVMEKLGYNIIYSDSIDTTNFDRGFRLTVSEQCLPVKLFYSHLDVIREKKPDYIFIPQFASLKKDTHCCPAIINLPLLAQTTIKDLPDLLTITIDYNRPLTTYFNFFRFTWQLTQKPHEVIATFHYFVKVFNSKINRTISKRRKKSKGAKIGIAGHKYALNDPVLNMGLMDKIHKYGYSHITSEVACQELKGIDGDEFGCRALHWDFGREIVSVIQRWLTEDGIVGIIFITFFGCGIDAFIQEVFKNEASKTKPYLCLSIDEHSSEIGYLTRIEAFLDMI